MGDTGSERHQHVVLAHVADRHQGVRRVRNSGSLVRQTGADAQHRVALRRQHVCQRLVPVILKGTPMKTTYGRQSG